MRGGVQLDADADAAKVGAPRRGEWLAALLPGAVAGGLALVAIALRWRGSDLPAHFFRVGLVERDGFAVWNNHWFGGHDTLGYGVLFPMLGTILGIWTVAVASAAGSAVLVDQLIIGAVGHRKVRASLWFAAGTVTNVAIGRLPFALGMLVGLGALLAAQRRRMVVAVVLTVATAAASPVVSAFLAIVFIAWALVVGGAARCRLAWRLSRQFWRWPCSIRRAAPSRSAGARLS